MLCGSINDFIIILEQTVLIRFTFLTLTFLENLDIYHNIYTENEISLYKILKDRKVGDEMLGWIFLIDRLKRSKLHETYGIYIGQFLL